MALWSYAVDEQHDLTACGWIIRVEIDVACKVRIH